MGSSMRSSRQILAKSKHSARREWPGSASASVPARTGGVDRPHVARLRAPDAPRHLERRDGATVVRIERNAASAEGEERRGGTSRQAAARADVELRPRRPIQTQRRHRRRQRVVSTETARREALCQRRRREDAGPGPSATSAAAARFHLRPLPPTCRRASPPRTRPAPRRGPGRSRPPPRSLVRRRLGREAGEAQYTIVHVRVDRELGAAQRERASLSIVIERLGRRPATPDVGRGAQGPRVASLVPS